MEANFGAILPLLARYGVKFIVIGGGAAIAHGSARLTSDVDVVSNAAPRLRDHCEFLQVRRSELPTMLLGHLRVCFN
jgi:predicted nucleotidyltransferase